MPARWDIDMLSDVRLKMCIQITGEDFLTIHHELGHKLLPARLQRAAAFYSATAPTTVSMRRWGTPSALSITPSTW